ncbi:hypothetical protein [Secundilactobacillus silagei]|nr:hypothetical protein [Secundilactobacillus silagei]
MMPKKVTLITLAGLDILIVPRLKLEGWIEKKSEKTGVNKAYVQ